MSEPSNPAGAAGPRRPRQPKFVEPMSVNPHIYECLYTPSTCTTYVHHENYEIWVNEPPPPYLIITDPANCAGTYLQLNE